MAASFENNISVSDDSQLASNGWILIDKFKTYDELQQFLKRLSSFKVYLSDKKNCYAMLNFESIEPVENHLKCIIVL
jgi:hypothetical protein